MTLRRSSTAQNKARPITPSPLHVPTSPTGFLPPSHYAAAAGLVYAPPHRSSRGRDTYKDGYHEIQPPNHPSFSFSISQVQASQSSSSDSSFEFKPAGDLRYSESIKGHHTPSKRQSQLGNLPLLEAQLLPSLRDTIGRMTTPPSRPATNFSRDGSASLRPRSSFSSVGGSGHSTSSSSYSTLSSASSSNTPSSFSTNFQSPQQGPWVSTARQYLKQENFPFHHSAPNTPAPDTPSPAPLNSNPKSKGLPSLKSALKSPIPKILFNLPPSTGTLSTMGVGKSGETAHLQPRTQSKMSDESKAKANAPGNITGSVKMSANIAPSKLAQPKISRPRSRTDPGARSAPSAPPPASVPVSSNPVIPLRMPTADFPLRTYTHAPKKKPSFDHSSNAKRRTLIVTNATIVPSSSESEAESDGALKRLSAQLDGGRRFAVNTPVTDKIKSRIPWVSKPSSHQAIGLGLRCEAQTKPPAATTFEPVPTGYSHAHVANAVEPLELCRRRQEALLGIVDGLESGLGSAPANGSQTKGEEPETEGESDYCGQEGLAIGGSGDVGFLLSRTEETTKKRVDTDFPRRGLPEETPAMSSVIRQTRDHEQSFWQQSQTQGEAIFASPQPLGSSPRACRHQTDRGNMDRRRRSISTQARRNPEPSPTSHENGFDGSRSSAAAVWESSYAAAVQERKALGILPSSSDYFTGGSDQWSLSHAESDLSSVGSLVSVDDDGLSQGAESLFNNLRKRHPSMERSGGCERKKSEASLSYAGDARLRRASKESTRLVGEINRFSSQSRFSQTSRQSSVPSTYDDGQEELTGPPEAVNPQCEPDCGKQVKDSWKSCLSDTDQSLLLEKYGPQEMQRQELIYEMLLTEKSFVRRLHSTVHLFILPLRVRDQKRWISGVPSEVARLFDWLEDIVNLHTQILTVMEGVRSETAPLVESFAGEWSRFVPQFEVYQPYLVRLEEVAAAIRLSVEDQTSDFGEFVRIQESKPDCDGWSLERFLVEPVNRLARYPDYFRLLLSLTPKSYKDYLSTFALVHAIEMIIRVMTEVKAREDEYQLVKHISARIRGLPTETRFARRERRLLFRGSLHHVNIPSDSPLPERTWRDSAQPNGRAALLNGTQRRSRLIEAIAAWDDRRARFGSQDSSGSFAFTTKSRDSSSFSSDHVIPPLVGPSQFYRGTSVSNVQVRELSESGGLHHVLVFTDFILFTVPIPKLDQPKDEIEGWQLAQNVGISRILNVGECMHEGNSLIALDLLPVGINTLDAGSISDAESVTTIYLCLPSQGQGPASSAGGGARDDVTRDQWVRALRRCRQFTLRALSMPSQCGRYLIRGPNLDLESDTQKTTMSILASGLPLPKSPSTQFEETIRGERKDTNQQEREARGWWSVRFQQVLHEMQRQEL